MYGAKVINLLMWWWRDV